MLASQCSELLPSLTQKFTPVLVEEQRRKCHWMGLAHVNNFFRDSFHYTNLRAIYISATIRHHKCRFYQAQFQRSVSFSFRNKSLPVTVPFTLQEPASSARALKALLMPGINFINCAVFVILLSLIVSELQSNDFARSFF
jgi:hypothetical protein